MSANLWLTLLAAALLAFAIKLAGYRVPERWLSGPRTRRVMALLPVALLAALVAVQTFGAAPHQLVIDARVAGLAVAAVALWLRAPFLLVILLAGVATALLRLAGWA